MKMHHPKKHLFLAVPLCLAGAALNAQDWQVLDTFEGGEPQGTWAAGSGQPSIDTADGFLSIRPAPGGNSTSTFWVALPETFTSGQVTYAFDFYLPGGDVAHEVGFGTGSLEQMSQGGWGATGNRNRFQTVNEAPQNLAKVPEWDSDILAPTQPGMWYNIWLVYDLDASPQTVTAYSKKFTDPMESAFLTESEFAFNAENTDDWSSLAGFATGIGLLSSPPEGMEASDSLGGLFDNLYVSAGENLALTPTSLAPEWHAVDTFSGGSPDSEWEVDPAIEASFDDDALMVTGSVANAGLYTALPIDSVRSNFTVTFDMMLPSGDTGLNQASFAVVGNDQVSSTGGEFFGGADRFVTFGNAAPQALANFGQWPPSLGPDLLGGTVPDQWYHVWLVYDGSAMTVDFYAVPVADPVDSAALPADPVATFDLEGSYSDLGFFVVGAFLGGGDGIKLDNIYQALGEVIELSPTAGQFGGDNGGNMGPGEFSDYEVDEQGWVLTPAEFLGAVNVEYYPYIYVWNLGRYIYSEAGTGWYYISR
jgi:hypothetical protein